MRIPQHARLLVLAIIVWAVGCIGQFFTQDDSPWTWVLLVIALSGSVGMGFGMRIFQNHQWAEWKRRDDEAWAKFNEELDKKFKK